MDVGSLSFAATRHGLRCAHGAYKDEVHAYGRCTPARLVGSVRLCPDTEQHRTSAPWLTAVIAAEGVRRRRLQRSSKPLAPAGLVTRKAVSSSEVVCGYSEASIGGRTASIWTPLSGEGGTTKVEALGQYSINFSWQKLPHYILGLQLGGGVDQAQLEPAEGTVRLPSDPECGLAPVQTKRGVVIAHGLLCTRLDFANIAEELCKDQVLVIAPEFDDSVSHDEGVTAGGFIGALADRKPAEEQRVAVVEECIDWLRGQGVEDVGLLGHSRGGVTISQVPGRFARINIAGFLPPPVPPTDGFHPSANSSPMLIICGMEDEVCARPPSSITYVREVVNRMVSQAEEWYPESIGHLTVLDPRVRQQWAAKLGAFGLGGLVRPPPESSDFDKELVDRIVEFFRQKLSSSES